MRSTSSSQKLDLGFIIDASFPFRQDFKLVKNFLNMLTKKFTINDDNVRVGIILFNNDASLEVALADFQSNSDIVDAVDRLEILSGIPLGVEILIMYRRKHIPNKCLTMDL